MRSPAAKELIILAAMCFLTGEYALSAGQSNSLKCAEPPGGTVTCEKGQVPICRVKDGKVTGECKSLPPEGKTIAQQNARLLSIILDKEVTVDELMRNQDYQKILLEGRTTTAQAQISFLPFGPSINDLPSTIKLFADPEGSLMRAANTEAKLGPGLFRSKPVVRRRMDPTIANRWRSLYKLGNVRFDKGDYVGALSAYRKARKIALQHPSKIVPVDIYDGIGQSLYKLGRYAESLEAFQEAARLAPNDGNLMTSLGRTYYALDRFQDAEEAFRRARQINEINEYEFQTSLGSHLFKQEKYGEAELAFIKALRLRPDDAEVSAILGRTFYAQQKYAEAELAFIKALRLRPDDAEVSAILGRTLYAEHKYAEASEALERAVRLRPDDGVSFGALGLALYQLGRYAEAENALKRALPNILELTSSTVATVPSEGLYSELGRVLYTQLKYSEAEQAFRDAIRLKPDKADSYVGLADALYAQQKYTEAEAVYRRALALEPKNVIYQDRLNRLMSVK